MKWLYFSVSILKTVLKEKGVKVASNSKKADLMKKAEIKISFAETKTQVKLR
jgi:hypothetical protein